MGEWRVPPTSWNKHMSRSRKRTPITGMTTAPSDKPFKRAEHSRERTAVRAALRQDREPPPTRLYGDPALGLKDGKQYAPDLESVRRK